MICGNNNNDNSVGLKFEVTPMLVFDLYNMGRVLAYQFIAKYIYRHCKVIFVA